MNRSFKISVLAYFTILIGITISCHHDPVVMEDPMDPMDTMDNPMDTMNIPCDPDVIYFEFDVLPILKSNCALSGCHDATTAEKDIILDSYENVINSEKVKAFDLDDSELYELITETDPDKRMPPEPNSSLSSNQIEIIAEWILQGAENLTCDQNMEECDTTGVTFSGFVFPTLESNCIGCHSGGNPSGGQSLQTYSDIRPVALSGKLSAVINWAPGVPRMPQNSPKLNDCTIEKIKTWVESGAPDN